MVPPSFGNVNCETAWTTLASGPRGPQGIIIELAERIG